jgi:hypothetical protein
VLTSTENEIYDVAGIAVNDDGGSVLFWNKLGLWKAAESRIAHLHHESVSAAIYRPKASDWLAATEFHIVSSDGTCMPHETPDPSAIAVSGLTILVAGRNGVSQVYGTQSERIQCEFTPRAVEPLAGRNVFLLTGADAAALAIFNADTSELFYVPNPGVGQ